MTISTLQVPSAPGAAGERPDAPIVLSAEWRPTRVDPRSFPDQPTGQGAPPPTIANIRHLLEANGVVCRYDLIKKRTDVTVPGVSGTVDNSEAVTLAHVKSLLALHGIQNGDTRAILDAIASESPHNPVAEWIDSVPWDGRDRLADLGATLKTAPGYPPELKAAILYRWLLSAVAAALTPVGFSTRLVLTLQGPQSIGKTRWCLNLVSDPALRASVVKTDHHFDGGNKDQIITATRFWIVELGEVTSSFRKDEERLKGILTRDRDVVRVPYAAADSEWPRRTVFVASTNLGDFLSDPTGSTRWGVIAVEAIDYDHGIDMQQLFAQLAVDFRRGERWWFDREEEALLESWNERHQATSVVREAIAEVVDLVGDDTGHRRRMTATELLIEAGIERPTNPQARETGALLRSRFGDPVKVKGRWLWNLPMRDRGSARDDRPASQPGKSKFD